MSIESFQKASGQYYSEGHPRPESGFSAEEAERLLSGVESFEQLEKTLEYLVYMPMSNGERVMADEWIRRIDRVRNGEDPRMITSTGSLRASVTRLLEREQKAA